MNIICNRNSRTDIVCALVLKYVFESPGTLESGTLPLVLLKERKGAKVPFRNSIIGNFMFIMIDLKQIYCSYSRTQKIKNVFFIVSVTIFEVNMLLNRNKHNWQRLFCFM